MYSYQIIMPYPHLLYCMTKRFSSKIYEGEIRIRIWWAVAASWGIDPNHIKHHLSRPFPVVLKQFPIRLVTKNYQLTNGYLQILILHIELTKNYNILKQNSHLNTNYTPFGWFNINHLIFAILVTNVWVHTAI